MAYSLALADQVRHLLAQKQLSCVEKRMFGGLAFMVLGHLCVGVMGDEVICRFDTTNPSLQLTDPRLRPFDFTGRPMRGWTMLTPAGAADAEFLSEWLDTSLAFIQQLPERS